MNNVLYYIILSGSLVLFHKWSLTSSKAKNENVSLKRFKSFHLNLLLFAFFASLPLCAWDKRFLLTSSEFFKFTCVVFIIIVTIYSIFLFLKTKADKKIFLNFFVYGLVGFYGSLLFIVREINFLQNQSSSLLVADLKQATCQSICGLNRYKSNRISYFFPADYSIKHDYNKEVSSVCYASQIEKEKFAKKDFFCTNKWPSPFKNYTPVIVFDYFIYFSFKNKPEKIYRARLSEEIFKKTAGTSRFLLSVQKGFLGFEWADPNKITIN